MAIRDLGFPPREPRKPYVVPERKSRKVRLVTRVARGFLLLLVVVAIGIYSLLRSATFHSYVLKMAEQKASESLNTRVRLQNFAVHWSRLGLDLYGLTVYGGPGTKAPLLQVDHVSLNLRILSIIHRRWNLDGVTADHPVVNLVVDSSGQSNLPAGQSRGNSNADPFDLAIRRIVLDRGEVYYNDRKTVLNADLRDLNFQSSYDPTDGGRYFGALSYRDGHLQYGTYAPIPHDLRAQFDARRSGMTLSNLTLQSGQSQLLLNASLRNYASPKIHATYMVNLALGEMRNVINDASVPDGVVLVNGVADYSSLPERPLLETTSLQGTIRSRILRLRASSLRADIRDLGAQYNMADGNAELRDVSAQLLGGAVRGRAAIRELSGKQQGHLSATLHNLSLAELKTLANRGNLKSVAISGRVNGDIDATWNGSITQLLARANVTADGSLTSVKGNTVNTALPVHAVIHARYSGAGQEITLTQSDLRTPKTSVDLEGTVSMRSALQVRVEAGDLHELESVSELFSKPGSRPLDLHGTASFDGTVRGSTAAPQIAGQLNASNVQIRGSALRVLRTDVRANPSQISLQNGVLDLGRQGHVSFSLQSGLDDWSYTPSSPFEAKIDATQLSLGELASAANVTVPVSGSLNANLVAHGTQFNPAGHGDINLRNAILSGEPVQLAALRFQGTGEAVHADLEVRLAAGAAQGQLTYYPKEQSYDGSLQANNIHLEQLQTLRARHLQATGMLNLTVNGRGTLQDPQVSASVGIPQLTVDKQQIRDLSLQGNIVHHVATFSFGSQILNAPLRAQGKVALTGDYYADVGLDTPVIPLQPFLAAYAPAQAAQVNGQTEIHATLRGPLKKTQLLEAHVNIPILGIEYRTETTGAGQPANLQIAAVSPIRADYAAGVVTLQPGEIKGTQTDVHFQGRLPLTGSASSTLSVQGAIDLAIARVLDPTLNSSGQLQFDINAGGSKTDPTAEGQIRIVNASFSTPDASIGLSGANGVLTLRRDRLDITQFSGNLGGGAITASGGVAYRPAVQCNVILKGNDLRLLYPQTVRTDFSLNLAMTGNTDSALLQGQVSVNRISFTPDFDLSTFMSQFGGVSTPPATQGLADKLKLNIAVRSTAELNAVSPTVSIQGDANLRVIGTAANPVIVGRTNLTGGDLIFMGNRYFIQGGTIAFVNTIETEPVINLQANTTVQQYNIALRLRGPVDHLKTTYSSDPALAPADIIHLLAFGKTEAANAAPAQSTALGAESLVASQVSSQVTGRLQKALGVSQISVDPQLGATTGNQQQGARLTVQQRVTSKLFVTFSTNVTNTQNVALQMQYQFNRKWSVSGVRDQNGGFGLDGRYHKDF